ncbi:NAD(P)-binding protein [Rhizophagus clarus]|uniref:Probable quinone oxidoreductase n=1 Tax=Rhizophagus clarus TaxID=94130 RepID=A0A8H3LRS1_9GLOM|nr:NAD(P)-binding protein [Rhizophagus clarus]
MTIPVHLSSANFSRSIIHNLLSHRSRISSLPSSFTIPLSTMSAANLMKAVHITRTGGPEVLEYSEIPRPGITGTEDVLVKNLAIGLKKYSNLTKPRSGLYKITLPTVIGREGAGIVESVGEGVKDVCPGDHVVYFGAPSYAEYTTANAKYVAKLPEGIDFKLGAASLLQGLTAWTLVTQSYSVQKNDWVLIHAAAGGVGLLLAQLSKQLGANVIGTVSTPEKAEMAKTAGADHIINYSHQDVIEEVQRLTNNLGVHVVYDGVGVSTWEASLVCARRLGSVISFGNASGAVPPFIISRLAEKNLKLMRPSLFGYLTTKEEFQKYTSEVLEKVAQGNLNLKIWKTYKLSEAKQAHIDLEGRKTSVKRK